MLITNYLDSQKRVLITIEHKSHWDKKAYHQVIQYALTGLALACQNSEADITIYPMVFYHGAKPLNHVDSLLAQLSPDDPVMNIVLEKGVQVIDVQAKSSFEIDSAGPGALLGQIFKLARSTPTLDEIESLVPAFQALGEEYRNFNQVMLEYLLRCGACDEQDVACLKLVCNELITQQSGGFPMMSMADMLESIGEKRGLEQGLEQGRKQGMSKGKQLMRSAAEKIYRAKQEQAIRRMLASGASIDVVMEVFQVDREFVEHLQSVEETAN